MRRLVLLAAVSAASLALCDSLAAQPVQQASDVLRAQRLAGLAKVWGNAKYFHPALAYRRDIDWDSALVEAIPAVRAATNREQYAAAVQRMLARLEDPLTRVTTAAPRANVAERALDFRATADSVLVVTVGSYYALFGAAAQQKLKELPAAIASAKAVVFDLRSAGPTEGYGRLQLTGTFAEIQRLLVVDTLQSPGERRRVYYGYESPSVFSSGQYRAGYFVQNGTRISPARNARALPTVFVVNQHAGLLSAALPMQDAGRAQIVYDGDIDAHTIGDAQTIELGEGVTAQVRRSEPVFADGTSAAFRPDAIVPAAAAGADAALDRALQLARNFQGRQVDRRRLPAALVATAERSYAQMRPVSLEYRLLGAFRYWNAIANFFPYKQLMDRDWDAVLLDLIPLFERAEDAKSYAQAVATMTTHIHDSHGSLNGPLIYEQLAGTGMPPIRVSLVEDQIVVTVADSAAVRAGVAVGDVVVQVDGQPARARFDDIARYQPASTPQSRMHKATLTFMNGAPNSTVQLTLQGGDGRTKQVALQRRHEDYLTLYNRERTGDIVRILPGNIGYVDLDRLDYGGVDAMFTTLKDTRAIIFDMRGYPKGTIWAIAPRLTDSTRVVARFDTPLVGHPTPGSPTQSQRFEQTVDPSPAAQRYRGRTVMLMDERSVSQAEHTGLYLKAVNNTTFVGSRTQGANGEITFVPVPGGITIGFTGQAVTWPDGRQLQRIGLIPDVEARPTIAGIRAGRDEVLEAALRLLTPR